MMKTMYQCLEKQKFTREGFSLVPIRWEDRYDIMQWRNEQMYHLRQDKLLTKEDQDTYFENSISKLFNQEQPEQILFSFLKEETCIGYGGLVHIDWKLKSAEISFLIDTKLEKKQFSELWLAYLPMIENIAFDEIILIKIYTYSYELRPKLYHVLDQSGFILKERISNVTKVNDNEIDALIHIKKNEQLSSRLVKQSDSKLLYDWANEPSARNNSINSKKISWEEHTKWFNQKMNSPKTKMYLFFKYDPVGVLRLEETNHKLQISFSTDVEQRGKGIGNQIISFALNKFPNSDFCAQVLDRNISSHKIFLKNNFQFDYFSNLGVDKVTHYIKKAPHEKL